MTDTPPSETEETQGSCYEEVDACFSVVLPPLGNKILNKSGHFVSKARKYRRGHRALPRIQLQDLPVFHYLNKNHTIQPEERWDRMKRHARFSCKETHSLCLFRRRSDL